MGGSRSFSKTESSRKTREKIILKKKSLKRESKRQRHDSVSSGFDDDSVSPQRPKKSSRSKSDYRTRKTKDTKLFSSHSNDLPVSSDSNYSSFSDKDGKYRKVRRARVRVSSKKRERKRLPFPDENGDGYKARKRKRSDKDHIVNASKKSSKKKLRKYLSDSSISDKESCSAGSTSDDNRKRRQVILDDDIGSPRGRESYSNNKKNRIRSPSSSYDKNSDRNHGETRHDKAVSHEIKSRHLRSVIAVVCESLDGRGTRLENDFHKEKIVYDQDDYPSSKILDSDHDRSKTGSDSSSHGTYDKRVHAGNVACKEAGENIKSRTNEGYPSNANYDNPERAYVTDFDEKGKGDFLPLSAAGANDLESILRRRALENLKKYREELTKKSNNMIIDYEHDAKDPFRKGSNDEENKSTEQDVSNVHELKHSSDALLKRERSVRIVGVQNIRDCEGDKDSEMTKQASENPANQPSLLGCSVLKKDNNEQIKSAEEGVSKGQELRLRSGVLLKREISEIIDVQKLPDSEQINKDPEMIKQTVENPTNQLTPLGSSEGSEWSNVASCHASFEKPVPRSDTIPLPGALPTNNACSSSTTGPFCVGPTSEERKLGQHNEAEDSSQFKKKTMSVMRGGEMVEVSYKIYIPKRAPALARRQLRK